MPCESCAVQFSVFRRRRACPECERWYCSACLRRGGGAMCAACRALSTRPLARHAIAHLKVRDLQAFLQRQNVSTRGCVEKEELLSLCVSHVNSAGYRRRASRSQPGTGAFSSLKGLTTNLNEFINHAFDIRTQPHPAPPPQTNSRSSCYNSAHGRAWPTPQPAPQPARPPPPSPTAPVPPAPASNVRSNSAYFSPRSTEGVSASGGGARSPDTVSSRSSSLSARVDTADCFEVEDVDDSGWEFVTRPPADPLPNDSEILLTVEENSGGVTEEESPERGQEEAGSCRLQTEEGSSPATPQRAASELELRSPSPSHTDTDTASLKDEPMFPQKHTVPAGRVALSQLQSPSELEALSVRQLKELLSANRVEYRGALERRDLLDRAATLYRHHAQYRDQVESLPLEECCKICMAAPLECVLLECGHMAACTDCGKRLAECPICRRYVTRAVRFFRS